MKLRLQNLAQQSNKIFMLWPPMIWMIFLLFIPVLVVIRMSLSTSIFAIPPFTDIFTLSEDLLLNVKLDLNNYIIIFKEKYYYKSLLDSILVSFVATIIILIISYPIALIIANSPRPWNILFLILIMLPFWSSYLIRVYSWVGVLGLNGIISDISTFTGLSKEPISLLNTRFAVYLGFVYTYLPLMILPLYTAVERIDYRLNEAAFDLGAGRFTTFIKVTLPLSMPGAIVGFLFVFIPMIGDYITPSLLGSNITSFIGKMVWLEFFQNRDWPLAAALAMILMTVLFIPCMLLKPFLSKGETNHKV